MFHVQSNTFMCKRRSLNWCGKLPLSDLLASSALRAYSHPCAPKGHRATSRANRIWAGVGTACPSWPAVTSGWSAEFEFSHLAIWKAVVKLCLGALSANAQILHPNPHELSGAGDSTNHGQCTPQRLRFFTYLQRLQFRTAPLVPCLRTHWMTWVRSLSGGMALTIGKKKKSYSKSQWRQKDNIN